MSGSGSSGFFAGVHVDGRKASRSADNTESVDVDNGAVESSSKIARKSCSKEVVERGGLVARWYRLEQHV